MIPISFRKVLRAAGIALSALALTGCVSQRDTTDIKGAVVSTPLSADSETVAARRDVVDDPARAKKLVLFTIAQDCMVGGFQTFAFTSVGEPKPHLPNQPPGAPVQIARVRTFDPPSSVVPDIEPGTVVTVKFYRAGDPLGANSIYAGMIVANFAPELQK